MKDGQLNSICGGQSVDDRGCIRFVNDFNFEAVKRFYQVENFSVDTIRAFHGHMKEAKYVYVVKGSVIVCAVKLTDIHQPSKEEVVNRFVLSNLKPQVLYIPPGYANGFKTLEPNTIIQFFSTCSLEESKGDDYRFAFDYWGSKIWDIENR